MLAELRGLTFDGSELGQTFGRLAARAAECTAAAAAREYTALFIGVGRGELLPYGSYYLTGFLNEKPLAALRADMRRLGLRRDESFKEPEDHIGSLAAMMAGLVGGELGEPASLEVQREFFASHIGNWAPHLFGDLEKAATADLYRPVGTIGRLFMVIEETAFGMV